MFWDVVEVKPESGWALQARFADGASGRVRFTIDHFTGVFQPLADPHFFDLVFIDRGAVAWPGGIDLAPDAMYEEIRACGEWILDGRLADSVA